jgi:hypothetical protein
MQEKSKPDDDHLRIELQRLGEQIITLQAENERLKQEVIRLRSLQYAKMESNMSSKLRDALRE